jgi:hypothetical protein
MDQVVPPEEDFTGSQIDPLHSQAETESQSQDSNAMALRRDAICNAMWEGRGTSRV